MMNKKRILSCTALLVFTPIAFAMQPMDDQSLAQTTGQDGINVGINASKLQFNQISIIDRDGLGTTVDDTKKAGLVMSGIIAGVPTSQTFNVSFLGANSTSPTLNMSMDVDGGKSKPFANIGLSFGSNITGIQISPFAMYLSGANSTSTQSQSKSIFTGTSRNPDVVKLLKMDNGIDINFVPSNQPKVNFQLGNVPQGRLLAFSGAIQSICANGIGCPITLITDSGNGNSDLGLSFNFQLMANDKVNGISLNGFYGGVEQAGFVFGNTGESSKFDLGINQMIMGKAGSTSTSFGGLQNGSMGSFGAIGTSVTDLKMRVSGL